jgi:serine/threonine protein kinase
MTSSLPVTTLLRRRYLIQQVLGQGGFARTYLAMDQERFQEPCVIKEFVVSYQDEALIQKAKGLFQRESSILHQVKHPQIPRFWAAFEEDDRLFLVQDYVKGDTYRKILQERHDLGKHFTETEIIHLLAHLLPVLSYLHRRQIVHRDISPDNIILKSQTTTNAKGSTERSIDPSLGLPVLIDFGAVKEATSGLTLVSSMTRVGKVGYAPPEQLQTGNVKPHSDLYALAVSCLVLLTGREPNVLLDSQTLSWCWEPHAQVSPVLEHILRKMLSLHPGDRYPNAHQVWTDLLPLAQEALTLDQMVSETLWDGEDLAEALSPTYEPETTCDASPAKHPTSKNHAARKLTLTPTIQEKSLAPSLPWHNLSPIKAIAVSLIGTLGIGACIFRTPMMFGNANVLQNSLASPEQIASDQIPTEVAPNNGQPYEIQFNLGEISKVVQGNLQGSRIQIHTLRASRGQIMTATLNGSGVLMNLVRSDNLPLESSSTQTRIWTGTLPADDEYQVHVSGSGAYSLEVSVTPLSRQVPVETQHIKFPVGKSGTTVTGNLQPKQMKRYFVNAKNSKMMILSNVEGTVTVSILSPKGIRIGGTSVQSKSWQGRIPMDGNYVLEVTSDKDVTPYAMSIEIY